jgi:ABC-type branched-subunit amino acid transport system substrate-binding protein
MQQQGGALPESFVIAYGRQLCEIVAFLEKGPQPIIHGAISPQTIMIDQGKNRVALLYLPILPPSFQPEYNSIGYIPPEQARGQIVSSSDLYAIAATMHHAVTGYSPHDRLAHFYPPARRLNPRVTASLEEILARQLRLSIKQRYPDAQSMLNDLSKLSASYSLKIEEKPLEPIIQTTSRRASIWLLFQTKPVLAFSLVLLCLILVSAIAVVGISTYTVQAQQTDYTQQLHTELDSFNKQGIGISDGRLVFDTYKGRLDSTLKMEAASAIQTANMSAAVNLLSQAVSADPIDGEALIYNEDMHILQTNAPYVTIVVGLPIDDSDEHLTSARVQLQAIYLAQHETNTQHLLPNGLKLRILIANSGKDNNNVATVAQFVANRVSLDGNPDHIITVVGWPYSSQTVNARDILAGVHIPLVSQTASSVQLSGSSPYFFRVCPVDDMQGQALGSLIAHDMNVKKLLVLHDPTDPYSSSLADAVAGSAQSLGATISTGTFTETQTTVDQYQQFANQVVNEHDDAIFLAGLSVDGIRLAHAIGNASRDNPHNKVLHSLKIIGGDGLTHAGLFGGGNNADAEIVRTFPQDMRRITATEFADAGEWNFLHIGQKQQPFFFSDWSSTYQSSPVGPNATDPTQEGILTYDAVGVVIHATSLSSDTPTGDTIQRILPTLGTGNVAAYQGVSGRIAFNGQGNPIDKAVVVVAVQDNGHNGNELHIQKIIGQFR